MLGFPLFHFCMFTGGYSTIWILRVQPSLFLTCPRCLPQKPDTWKKPKVSFHNHASWGRNAYLPMQKKNAPALIQHYADGCCRFIWPRQADPKNFSGPKPEQFQNRTRNSGGISLEKGLARDDFTKMLLGLQPDEIISQLFLLRFYRE